MSSKLALYSFFSGIGFLDFGFEKAGLSLRFVNEVNPVFLSAHQYARSCCHDKPLYSNVSIDNYLDYSGGELLRMLLSQDREHGKTIGFLGGPPCPDFSIAGKNKGEHGENGRLTSSYVQLIVMYKPDFFILENVKGLYATKRHREFLETQKTRLRLAGFEIWESIENALEYGAPQFRERLIIAGFKRGFQSKDFTGCLQRNKTYELSSVLSRSWPKSNAFSEDSILLPPNGILKRLTVDYWFKKNNVNSHVNANDIFHVKNQEKFLTIAEGDTSRKSFKRLHRWRYSPTAAYGHNEVHLHPYKARRISVAEALALQSLPKDFVVLPNCSLSDKFKMVGNGVPYLMARGIANAVIESISLR